MFWVCEPVLFYDYSLFKFYMKHTRVRTSSNSHYAFFKYRCKPKLRTNSCPKPEPCLLTQPHRGSGRGSPFILWDSPLLTLQCAEPRNHCHPGTKGRTSIWGLLVWTQSLSYSAAVFVRGLKKSKENEIARRALQFAKHSNRGCPWEHYSHPVRTSILSPLQEETEAQRI